MHAEKTMSVRASRDEFAGTVNPGSCIGFYLRSNARPLESVRQGVAPCARAERVPWEAGQAVLAVGQVETRGISTWRNRL